MAPNRIAASGRILPTRIPSGISCAGPKGAPVQLSSEDIAPDIPSSVRRFDLMQRLHQLPYGPAVFHRTCSGSERIRSAAGAGRQTDLGDGGGGGGLLLSKREGHGGGRVGGGRAGKESKGSALHGYYLGNKGLSKVDRYTIERQSGRKKASLAVTMENGTKSLQAGCSTMKHICIFRRCSMI